MARTGASLEITTATVDGVPAIPRTSALGALRGAPGTLVELPLPRCAAAGTTIHAELDFRLQLGSDAGERVGYAPADRIAWFGTAFPLLAWVRGEGWARDPAVDLYGETVVSEDFRLDTLDVIADDGQAVAGTGVAVGTGVAAPGRTMHRFTADAVRDVAVAVGDYELTETRVGDVRVHVATPRSGTRAGAAEWSAEIARQLTSLQDLLGPYPYTDIWATIVPTQSDGVEFPTALQFGDKRRAEIPSLIAHELAHQWFYALVGNNQARHPWLDEAFATWAQALVTGQEDLYQLSDMPTEQTGNMGQPMQYWANAGGFDNYVRGVYNQGAAVLLAGRARVGAARFDAAVRDYIQTNAHRVARPADVAAAFQHFPEVLELLRAHGAIDQEPP